MNRSRRLFAFVALATAIAACSQGVGNLRDIPPAPPLAQKILEPEPSQSETALTSVPSATSAAAPPRQADCGILWGSLPENHLVSTYTTATIEDLRASTHDRFDRLVVDLGPSGSGLPGPQGNGYQVRYAPKARAGESGDRLPLEDGAVLAILVNAAAHDDEYQPTYDPGDPLHAVDVAGFSTFRQVAFLGTFESQTEIVLGVRARLPFRAFVLSGPDARSRLVIDVAHRW